MKTLPNTAYPIALVGRIAALIMLSCCALMTHAESVEDMLAQMAVIENNTALRQAAIAEGAERAQLCFRCHGKDGNSTRDYIPNLASQNAAYLFTQFEKFADGSRQDYVMNALAKHLTAEERIAIALYYSQHEVVEREQPVAAAAEGERVYKSMCFACHGEAGHGNAQYPRIAGQPYEFLQNTLLKFHSNDSERRDSPMVSIIQNLDEAQLNDVAAYIAHMP